MITKMRKIGVAGFSLVELMVVVAIIGILASVAIPNFQRFQRKARASEAKTQLAGVATAEEAFRAEWEQYSSDLVAAGFAPTGTLRYRLSVAAGAAIPPGYTGAYVPANISTSVAAVCVLANGCSEGPNVAACAMAMAATSTTAFTATACGMIGGTVTPIDEWSLNNLKVLMNDADGTF